MKRHVKQLAILFAFAVILGSLLFGDEVSAKTYKITTNSYGYSCSVVISGKKVYYSVTETGSIYCYNIKTGKTTTVIKKNGKGFYQLKKKGNYLYALYDSYGGSDGADYTIVRVSLKNKKMTTLAKGNNFVIQKDKIYFTKTKRTVDEYNNAYDKKIGVYSMTLSGKKQKSASKVKLSTAESKKIKTSKGTLYSTSKYSSDIFYWPDKLYFKNKSGKKTKIYDVAKDKNAAEYGSIGYYTVQGDYIVYKKYAKDKKYGSKGQLVLVKTNGKGKKVIYSRVAVSGW